MQATEGIRADLHASRNDRVSISDEQVGSMRRKGRLIRSVLAMPENETGLRDIRSFQA